MTDIKVAASLTASLLAPKGEARPAGWRAIAARTTEPRPWYAALAHDRPGAERDADAGPAEPGPESRPRPEGLRLRAVPLTAPAPEDEGLGEGLGTPARAAPRDATADASARPTATAESATPADTTPADTMPATAPAASLARLGGRQPDAAGAGLPTAAVGDAAADRVRITARLDRDLHRRLKLASAHLGASSQELIADALSHYLDGVAAGPMRGHCACLSAGTAGDCGGCGSADPRA